MDNLTREQMAVIFMNYAKFKGYDISVRAELDSFADAGEISAWALDAMSFAGASGLIQGDGNRLMPQDEAQRSQMAAIL